MSDFEIIYRGPMDMSGYGVAGRSYVWAFEKAGIKLKLVPKVDSSLLINKGIDDKTYAMIDRLRNNKVDWRAPVVQHVVADRFRRRAKSRLNVLYTIFEMTKIPQDWSESCSQADLILTGSQYSKQAFVNSGIEKDKIEILPHTLDFDKYKPQLKPLNIENLSGFNFVSVFDFQTRKDWRGLLRAYWSAFSWADDVTLALKCYRGAFEPKDQEKVRNKIRQYKQQLGFAKTPKILFYGFDLPDNLMPHLYNTFDCYVFMGREGFGLPAAEAQACALPVIGPQVGGNREFMTEDNSYLVNYLKDEPIDEEMIKDNPSFKGLEWSVHDWEHLAHLMRHVFDNREEAKKKGEQARKDAIQKLHWKKIAQTFKQQMQSRL